jgi:hypothetical protein
VVDDATVVESRRRGGRVEQVHVCHLGSITVEPAILGVLERGRFWQRAQARLEALDVTWEQRGRLAQALLARVPLPEAPAPWDEQPLIEFWRLDRQGACRVSKAMDRSAYAVERGSAVLTVLDALAAAGRAEEAETVRTLLNYRSVGHAFRYCAERGYIALPPVRPRPRRASTPVRPDGEQVPYGYPTDA